MKCICSLFLQSCGHRNGDEPFALPPEFSWICWSMQIFVYMTWCCMRDFPPLADQGCIADGTLGPYDYECARYQWSLVHSAGDRCICTSLADSGVLDVLKFLLKVFLVSLALAFGVAAVIVGVCKVGILLPPHSLIQWLSKTVYYQVRVCENTFSWNSSVDISLCFLYVCIWKVVWWCSCSFEVRHVPFSYELYNLSAMADSFA